MAYLLGPLEVKRSDEHEDLEMVEKDLEVDSEEGLLFKSRTKGTSKSNCTYLTIIANTTAKRIRTAM